MSDEKSNKECSARGCWDPKDFESRFCGKHSCSKCYGSGKLGKYGVKCIQCNGTGAKK